MVPTVTLELLHFHRQINPHCTPKNMVFPSINQLSNKSTYKVKSNSVKGHETSQAKDVGSCPASTIN